MTAQGLIDAYQLTKKVAYLMDSEMTYSALLANSVSTDATTHKIRCADISFLVQFSKATGYSKYALFAKYVRGVRLSQAPS